MLDLLHLSLPELVRLIGYPGLFFMVLMENGLPFGIVFPGDSPLFTAGFLASQGFFDIIPLALVITVAAILGDALGYWFGKTVGTRYLGKPDARFMNAAHVAKTESFFVRYGARAILFARFVPTARTFVPILAGVARMRYRSFFFYNVIGGILWGAGLTFLGYGLGAVFPQSEHYLLPIILVIILVSFAPLGYELISHKLKRAEQESV